MVSRDRQRFNVQPDVRKVRREIPGFSCSLGRLKSCLSPFARLLSPFAAPHYSSDYFRQELYDHMRGIGFDIPQEKWFTNLYEKGNTGAASIYIILEELFHSGRLRPGQRLLCFIPESGRFSICYMLLTVV